MTEKETKYNEIIGLSKDYLIMLDKLSLIHSTSKERLIELLIRKESVRFNLVEARGFIREMV